MPWGNTMPSFSTSSRKRSATNAKSCSSKGNHEPPLFAKTSVSLLGLFFPHKCGCGPARVLFFAWRHLCSRKNRASLRNSVSIFLAVASSRVGCCCRFRTLHSQLSLARTARSSGTRGFGLSHPGPSGYRKLVTLNHASLPRHRFFGPLQAHLATSGLGDIFHGRLLRGPSRETGCSSPGAGGSIPPAAGALGWPAPLAFLPRP